jgi:hypothetical protein
MNALSKDPIRIYLLLPIALLISCSEKKESSNQPNIILIYTDDLGYRDVYPIDHNPEITPNLIKGAISYQSRF